MASIKLTKENFEAFVANPAEPMVLVDFWAPWCAPCVAFGPTYEAASDRHAGIGFGKVNVEEQPELAAAFDIRSIPTLMLFRDKVILYAEAGALPPAALDEVIAKAKLVDMDEVRSEIPAQQDAARG